MRCLSRQLAKLQQFHLTEKNENTINRCESHPFFVLRSKARIVFLNHLPSILYFIKKIRKLNFKAAILARTILP